MQTRTEFYIGKNLPNKWSGIYGYRPDNASDYADKGMMCAVARIESPSEEFQSEKFAHFSIDALQESYFNDENNKGNTLKRLEKACWDMKSKMDLFLSRESEVSEKGIDIEMAIAVFKDNYLFVVVVGESYVFIKRGNEIVNIAEALEDINKTGFIKSGSLEIEEGDFFSIATSPAITDRIKFNESFSALNISELKRDDIVGASLMLIGDESLPWAEVPVLKTEEEDFSIKPVEDTENLSNKNIDLNTQAEVDGLNVNLENVNEINNNEVDQNFENIDEKNNSDLEYNNFSEDDHEEKFSDEKDLDNDLDQTPTQSFSQKFSLFRNKSKEKLLALTAQTKSKYNEYKESRKNKINLEESEYSDDESNNDDQNYEEEDFDYGNSVHESENNSKHSNSKNSAEGIKRIPLVILSTIKIIIEKIRNHFKNNQTTYAHYINKFFSGFKSIGSILTNLFKENILGQSSLDRRSRNRRVNVKRNRWVFIILVVVISLFLYNSISNARSTAKENRIREENTLALNNLKTEYSTLATEVGTVQFAESATKTETLNKLESLSSRINAEKATNQFATDLDNLSVQTSAQKDKLQLITRVDTNVTVSDLSKSFAGVETSDLELSENFLFVTDNARNVIYRLATNLGATPEVFITGLTAPTQLVRNTETQEIIVYDKTEAGAISKFNPIQIDSLSRFSDLTASSVEPSNVLEVATFEGNNALYELRNLNQMIYKREKIGDEYASGGAVYRVENPPNWKTDAELSKAIDIEVPFEIYVLVDNLGVRRYTAGGQNEIDFNSFKGLTIADFDLMKEATSMDVTNFGGAENTGYLAVSINQTSTTPGKILLFEVMGGEKSLKLVKQYQSQSGANLFNDVKEIQIDVANLSMYVLDGGKVLKLGL